MQELDLGNKIRNSKFEKVVFESSPPKPILETTYVFVSNFTNELTRMLKSKIYGKELGF